MRVLGEFKNFASPHLTFNGNTWRTTHPTTTPEPYALCEIVSAVVALLLPVFHEIFRADGHPYREREARIIRELTGTTAAAVP
jgi:hypothetical protein